MMEEEFYSTIKLSSGEEIICKVCYLPNEDSLLIEDPRVVEKLSHKRNGRNHEGFILKDWINSTYENMFVIKMNQVITITELDKRIETFYLNTLRGVTYEGPDRESDDSVNVKVSKFSKQMGYLGSVKENKEFLEDIFKRS